MVSLKKTTIDASILGHVFHLFYRITSFQLFLFILFHRYCVAIIEHVHLESPPYPVLLPTKVITVPFQSWYNILSFFLKKKKRVVGFKSIFSFLYFNEIGWQILEKLRNFLSSNIWIRCDFVVSIPEQQHCWMLLN